MPIGYVNVSMDGGHDLGYGLLKEFWHRGIVSEAAAALIEQVRRDGMDFITATHDRNNPRSGSADMLGISRSSTYRERFLKSLEKALLTVLGRMTAQIS